MFLLPKKIVKLIVICRSFLWTGKEDVSKKALLAWDTICKPKLAEGLNFTNMMVWNKAAICTSLWNLCNKKDKIWVKWVHTYYIQGEPIEEVQAKQTSWVVQKILKAKNYVEEAGYTM